MGEHSLLSPSGSPRWSRCPGSVARCRNYPRTTSEYAEEGTLAHAVAASVLTGETDAVPEELEELQVYIDFVRTISQGAVQVWVEESLDLSDVLEIDGEKGTGDFIALMPNGDLIVPDLKWGKGVKVYADGNEQLILYGLGAIRIAELVDEVKRVRLFVVQPRLGHVSEAVYTVEEMRSFETDLHKSAGRALQMYNGVCEPEYSPGEKQCRWCPAKGDCEALAKHCMETIIGDFDDLTIEETAENITAATDIVPASPAERIARLLPALDLISQWVSAVKGTAMQRALAGEQLPGYKLVEGKAGNRKWVDEKEVEETMKSMRLKKEARYEVRIISPTVAEKLLKSSARKWNRLTPLITRTPPAPTLVPESDKRPALTLNAQAEDFEDLSEQENDDLI